MSEPILVPTGCFCWNPNCADYAQVGKHNLVKNGHTHKGTQRYRCNTCGHTTAETKGTLFYGRHHSQQTILECLALLADRMSLAAIHRVKGIKEETVLDWLQEAAQHAQQLEELLMAHHRLRRVQLDALWTYVGRKGAQGGALNCPTEATSGAPPPST